MKNPLTNEVLKIIRDYADKEEISLSEYGRRADVSKAWLSKLKHTDANLSLDTAAKLLDIAGYKLTIERTRSAELEEEKPKISRLKKVIENS